MELKNIDFCQDLSSEDMFLINGGFESAWYWVAYYVGSAVNHISNSEQSAASKLQNTALH